VGTRTTFTRFYESLYTGGTLGDTVTTFFVGESRSIQMMMFISVRYHFPPGRSEGAEPGIDVFSIFINFWGSFGFFALVENIPFVIFNMFNMVVMILTGKISSPFMMMMIFLTFDIFPESYINVEHEKGIVVFVFMIGEPDKFFARFVVVFVYFVIFELCNIKVNSWQSNEIFIVLVVKGQIVLLPVIIKS